MAKATTRVKCRQYRCGFVENPSLKSNKCHECKERMQNNGKRIDVMVFTNANPWYAGKLDDPQGGDMTFQHTDTSNLKRFEQIELQAKLLNYFLGSNKSNINHNADGAGKRSHDGQSRDGRRSKLGLANIGADGVSATVRICECEPRWSQKFNPMQWPAFSSDRIFLSAYHHRFHSTKRELQKHEARTCAWNAEFDMVLCKGRQEKMKEFQMQSLHYYSKSNNKSSDHHDDIQFLSWPAFQNILIFPSALGFFNH